MSGSTKPKLLYVTDLHYESRGRVYYEEDLELSQRLAPDFDLVLCHPLSARSFLGAVDGVLFRNAGPVAGFADEYRSFRARALADGVPVFNELTGKADMQGKQYLVDLWRDGFPVIPTVDRVSDLPRLPDAARYVVKPKDGADSAGLEVVEVADLPGIDLDGRVAQPLVDFEYEVSFYFLGSGPEMQPSGSEWQGGFEYALYAPDPEARWRLTPYDASADDLAFARRFIEWNDIAHGIQRVDAARTREGELLLMELEDVNPYLSLDLLPAAERERFIDRLRLALHGWLAGGSRTPEAV